MAKLNDYVLTTETAHILRVSPNTIQAWASGGKIPVFQNPANYYHLFRRTYMESFIKQIANAIKDTCNHNRKKTVHVKQSIQ